MSSTTLGRMATTYMARFSYPLFANVVYLLAITLTVIVPTLTFPPRRPPTTVPSNHGDSTTRWMQPSSGKSSRP